VTDVDIRHEITFSGPLFFC
jgi:hypothetical protein